MIPVAITTYPQGERERTIHLHMPGVPRIGETVHIGDDDVACMLITSVMWVYEKERGTWHVECSAR